MSKTSREVVRNLSKIRDLGDYAFRLATLFSNGAIRVDGIVRCDIVSSRTGYDVRREFEIKDMRYQETAEGYESKREALDKGFRDAVDSLAYLLNKHNINLRIVGSGDREARLVLEPK